MEARPVEPKLGTRNIIAHGYVQKAQRETRLRLGNVNGVTYFEFGTYNTHNGVRAPFGESNMHKWIHFAGVFHDTTWYVYVDGELAGQRKTDMGAQEVPSNLYIGGHAGENTRTFQGTIDEAVIYDRALTAEEIRKLAAAARP